MCISVPISRIITTCTNVMSDDMVDVIQPDKRSAHTHTNNYVLSYWLDGRAVQGAALKLRYR